MYRGKDKDLLKISLFANKFYFDEIYAKIVAVAQDGLASVVNFFDKLFIDGLAVRGSALTASGAGQLFRRLQVGNIQGYAFLFGLGVAAVNLPGCDGVVENWELPPSSKGSAG